MADDSQIRLKLQDICYGNASLNMTPEVCEAQAKRIADEILKQCEVRLLRTERAVMSDDAKRLLTEIIAFFSTCHEGLGDGWAHDDAFTSYGLDYRHRNGTQLWLDLEDDGTIHVLWKPVGQDKPTVMYFSHAVGNARSPEGPGDASRAPTGRITARTNTIIRFRLNRKPLVIRTSRTRR